MTAFLPLALAGFGCLATFVALIMTRRLSAVTALILVPIAFGLLAGLGLGVADLMVEGARSVLPTVVTLVFALLYFAVMIEAGLFEPLVRTIMRWAGAHPTRVTIASVLIPGIIALDGSGTTAALVAVAALGPVYDRLGMNKLMLFTLLMMADILAHTVPWGSPTIRAATAMHVDPMVLYAPMVIPLLACFAFLIGMAVYFGRFERKRLAAEGFVPLEPADAEVEGMKPKPWIYAANFLLTALLIFGMAVAGKALPAVMMAAFAVAVVINRPRSSQQADLFARHAERALTIALLVLSAGAFLGVMSKSGMIEAMATATMAAMPSAIGPYFAVVVAVLSMPLTFFLSNDAFYFGFLPLLGHMGMQFGLAPEEIARASLIGQPVHGLSPILPALYFICGLLKIEVQAVQAFALKWAIMLSLVFLVTALLVGAFPLSAAWR